MYRQAIQRPKLPRVSVVVRASGKGGLEATLESVCNQSLTDHEILVAGPSTTHASELLTAVGCDPRVRIHPAADSDLPAVQRNRLIQGAHGLFVAFIEEGDCWHPEKLERQVGWMREHPEFAFTFTGAEESGASPDARQSPAPRTGEVAGIFRELIERNHVRISTVMIRRSALRFFRGFDESPRLRGTEDFDLWLRIASRGHLVGVLNEPLARTAASSRPRTREQRRATRKRWSALRRFQTLQPRIPRDKLRALRGSVARTLRKLGTTCLIDSHARRSRRYLQISIRTRPVQLRGYALLLLSFLNPGISSRLLRRLSRADQKNG